MNTAKAGAVYFAIIFALGFVLGAARVTMVAPRLGELAATLLELPVILTAAWFVSNWLISRFGVPKNSAARLLMGLVAFGITMVSEPLLGLAFGRSLADQWLTIMSPAGIAGLGGQVIFGLIPWLRFHTVDAA